MDDAGLMHRRQPVADLPKPAEPLGEVRRTIADQLPQRRALDHVHHHEAGPRRLACVVDHDDMRMPNERGETCLACEGAPREGELLVGRVHNLHGDLAALVVLVACLPDLTERTAPEKALEAVSAEVLRIRHGRAECYKVAPVLVLRYTNLTRAEAQPLRVVGARREPRRGPKAHRRGQLGHLAGGWSPHRVVGAPPAGGWGAGPREHRK